MTEPELDAQWELMLNHHDGEVRRIAARAAKEPSLRALFPYNSLSHFRFSTTRTYPYSDCPYISPLDGGLYRARDWDGRPVLEGALDEAVAEVVRMIARAEGSSKEDG